MVKKINKNVDWESRIGRRLRLRDLHVLFTVVQSGSMARAAAALGITQPAVSAAIADLEHVLGVRLLDRSTHGVQPTLYCSVLLRRGRVAFDELRLGIKEIEFLADPTAGEVRLACPESIVAGLLVPVIDQLSRQYPRLRLHVSAAETTTLEYAQLHERSVDLVLARMAKPPSQGNFTETLNAEVLFNDRFCLAVGPTSKWARRRKIELAELVNEPWISTPFDSPGGSWFAEAFRMRGLEPPKLTVTTFSVHLRNYLTAEGRFITALPESLVRFNPQSFDLKILPIELPMPQWPVGIVTLKTRTLNPAASLFIECARDIAKAIAGVPGAARRASTKLSSSKAPLR